MHIAIASSRKYYSLSFSHLLSILEKQTDPYWNNNFIEIHTVYLYTQPDTYVHISIRSSYELWDSALCQIDSSLLILLLFFTRLRTHPDCTLHMVCFFSLCFLLFFLNYRKNFTITLDHFFYDLWRNERSYNINHEEVFAFFVFFLFSFSFFLELLRWK